MAINFNKLGQLCRLQLTVIAYPETLPVFQSYQKLKRLINLEIDYRAVF